MNELTQRGINALKAGDRATARLLLGAALKEDPNDAVAWLWLAGALTTDEERIRCLKQVLRIDPNNAAAQRGLAQLQAKAQPAAAEDVAGQEQPVTEPEQEPMQPQVAPHPAVAQHPAGSEAAEEAQPAVAEAAAVEEVAEQEQTVTEQQQAAQPPVEPQPSVAPQTAAVPPAAEARRQRAVSHASGEQIIFRTRPSLVLALLGFWTFLIGSVVVAVLLRDSPVLSLTLGIGLVIFLELIFIFAVLRIMSTRYELTDRTLLLRFRGKPVRIPHSDIYSAELRQSAVQQLLGTGDIHLRAAVKGELAELRIRNIPEARERIKQIQSLLKPAS